MAQDLLVYLVVAAAAAWVVWAIVLPGRAKRALKARFSRGGKSAAKGSCDRCGG